MQFLNTLQQIVQSESTSPFGGILRHFAWQARRTLRQFPCELTISHSRLLAEESTGVSALVNAMGMYDFHNMSLLKSCLARRPMAFVDVGANIGSYTLIASEVREAFVVSIEPHPATFAMLKRNVERNQRKNVACFNLALSDHDGSVNLTDKPGSSVNQVVEASGTNKRYVPVPCRTLDHLCAELGIHPDIVKMDVEGYEVEVLKGFGESLRNTSLLLIEGGERAEIRAVMRDNGMLGPLYFHFGENAFSPFPQRRAEDPIYLSKTSLKEFRLAGTKVLSQSGNECGF
jgi:FkbM family methyltransferase